MNEKKISLLKPYTNNDRLNDMSLEERANLINSISYCCANKKCEECPLYGISCNLDGIKKWLESEAAE